jgi:hypothetical protein
LNVVAAPFASSVGRDAVAGDGIDASRNDVTTAAASWITNGAIFEWRKTASQNDVACDSAIDSRMTAELRRVVALFVRVAFKSFWTRASRSRSDVVCANSAFAARIFFETFVDVFAALLGVYKSFAADTRERALAVDASLVDSARVFILTLVDVHTRVLLESESDSAVAGKAVFFFRL